VLQYTIDLVEVLTRSPITDTTLEWKKLNNSKLLHGLLNMIVLIAFTVYRQIVDRKLDNLKSTVDLMQDLLVKYSIQLK
jgi:hypothetical protein